MTNDDGRLTGNLILDCVDDPTRDRLLQHTVPAEIARGDDLFVPGETMTRVLFPCSGVVSLQARMLDGNTIEVATIGREGIVGLPVLLNGGRAGNIDAVCQVGGRALEMSAEDLERLARTEEAFMTILLRYSQALFNQLMQAAACHGLHSVTQRFARWLLQTADRMLGNDLLLTHQMLANMIGTRRASVSQIARKLLSAGLIDYGRGRVSIVDRDGLERITCECYQVVRAEYERLSLAPEQEGAPVWAGMSGS
jgi:CRP-like cAMP-binding protein